MRQEDDTIMVNDIYNAAHDKNGMKIYNAVVKMMKHAITKIHYDLMTALMKQVLSLYASYACRKYYHIHFA